MIDASSSELIFVDPAVPSCRIAIDQDGCLHLIIAIQNEPERIPQELEAIMVRVIEMNGVFLDIYSKSHYEMIFTPLVNQIFLGIAVQRRDPINVVFDTIEEFRSALKPIRSELSLNEQIGLFGEIWILLHVLLPNIGSRALPMWSGPESERHDFIGNNLHIEVKSTTKSEDRHEISRMDQLRSPLGKKLLFASVQLERSIGGSESIATLIDQVIAALGTNGKAIDEFESRLAKMKWHDGLRQSVDLKKFNLRDVQFFDVGKSFPRLPDDYIPPRGIIAIKYVIDISSQSTLDRSDIQLLVGQM